MIVIDTSAIIAIMYGEESAARLIARIGRESEGERGMSAASYLEAGTVIAGRRPNRPQKAAEELDGLLSDMAVDVVTVDAE